MFWTSHTNSLVVCDASTQPNTLGIGDNCKPCVQYTTPPPEPKKPKNRQHVIGFLSLKVTESTLMTTMEPAYNDVLRFP
jgi:hypothetical protein